MLAVASVLTSSWTAPALVPRTSPVRGAAFVRMDATLDASAASASGQSLEVGCTVPGLPCLASHADLAAATPSRQAEFESVKAAAQVAQELAPVVSTSVPPAPARKRDRVLGAFKGVVKSVRVVGAVRKEAADIVDESCDIDEPEVCTDEVKKGRIRQLSAAILKAVGVGKGTAKEEEEEEAEGGDAMEEGWLARSQGSSFKRTLEVWGFLAQCGLKIVKARKAKGDMTEADVSAAKTAAAEFIRDGLFRLGPTFVKLGQARRPPAAARACGLQWLHAPGCGARWCRRARTFWRRSTSTCSRTCRTTCPASAARRRRRSSRPSLASPSTSSSTPSRPNPSPRPR